MKRNADLGTGKHGSGAGRSIAERVALAGTFVRAALAYWLTVFPRVCRELARWRRRALLIADPPSRRLALDALGKRGNIEGAAAFAAFVPWRRRRGVTRALVAFQAIYNHVDMLAEQPCADPVARARRSHEALLVALDVGGAWPDGGEARPDRGIEVPPPGDEDYLAELAGACRAALSELPRGAAVAQPARRAAARIVAFQSLSLGEREILERWAGELTPAGSRLAWWETAAAAGSSLCVHALIAAAAFPAARAQDLAALERAYFPWIGALHSLLDSLVDEVEDANIGQLSLIGCYLSPADAARGMGRLAARSLGLTRELPGGRSHRVLLAAMAANYLSESEASSSRAYVREAIGGLLAPALLVFRARRLGGRLARALAGVPAVKRTPAAERSPLPATAVAPGQPLLPAAAAVAEQSRSADARAA
jgi:tetraprenyl-beta-curcumene synthase